MNFKPGEYTMRNGRKAIIEFEMREPCVTSNQLVGQAEDEEGNWRIMTWAKNGKAVDDDCGTHDNDLVPLESHRWGVMVTSNKREYVYVTKWCDTREEAEAVPRRNRVFLLQEIRQCDEVRYEIKDAK